MGIHKPWHRGPTHWPDTHFILQILDEGPFDVDDDVTVEAAAPFPDGAGKRAGNFTSDNVEKSGDMPDRGTTLVPFNVTLGDRHPTIKQINTSRTIEIPNDNIL